MLLQINIIFMHDISSMFMRVQRQNRRQTVYTLFCEDKWNKWAWIAAYFVQCLIGNSFLVLCYICLVFYFTFLYIFAKKIPECTGAWLVLSSLHSGCEDFGSAFKLFWGDIFSKISTSNAKVATYIKFCNRWKESFQMYFLH